MFREDKNRPLSIKRGVIVQKFKNENYMRKNKYGNDKHGIFRTEQIPSVSACEIDGRELVTDDNI